jgi:vacuolar-type H+-ATPase subunit D/Vma8
VHLYHLIQAQMILGEKKVEEASYLTKYVGEIEFDTDNIMGVKIPKRLNNIKTEIKPIYGFSDTCSRLDDANGLFTKLLTN